MAKALKVKLFPISSDTDLVTLAEFLASCSSVDHIVPTNGKVLVIYKE